MIERLINAIIIWFVARPICMGFFGELVMKILLVEPSFPIPPKSKNHKDFLPIGLLKLGAMYREEGDLVKLVRGEKTKHEIALNGDGRWRVPNKIMITSLFTYWKPYVVESVRHYRELFPDVEVTVGGIYASLMPDDCRMIESVDNVHKGVVCEAEKYPPAYDLIEVNPHPIDYQIIHTSRGCERKCSFCGTWKIEPDFIPIKSIKDNIKFKKLVFYDNNIFMNPYLEDILEELIVLKKKKEILWCESQSGFDGRLIVKKPHLAKMLRQAGFRYPRIAWDWRYKDHPQIKKQLNTLMDAGYSSKEMYVFVLYNWDIPFKEMEKKRIKCFEWGVQIADCRYRPLTQVFDNYNSRKKGQTSEDYYIHNGWTDELIKQFRKNIREQNICVRHGFPFYSRAFEHKTFGKTTMRKVKKAKTVKGKISVLKKIDADYWFPGETRYPSQKK